MTTEAQEPLRTFCSYSHRDEEYLNVLRESLRGLERQGLIEWWHDRQISPGWEWEEAIDKNLRTADIILLLVTRDFMASDYVYEKEINRAIERHDRGEARVIPIIVRPSYWEWSSFGKLQALPKAARPITRWPDQDEAWLDVVRGIRRAVEELLVERRERAARERYHKAVEAMRAGNKVTAAEVERLDALASDLGLSADTAADIEHKILDNTKEVILERREQATREKERQGRLKALYDQALELHQKQKWQAVVDVFAQIHTEDPEYPDREELLRAAREALEAEDDAAEESPGAREVGKHSAPGKPIRRFHNVEYWTGWGFNIKGDFDVYPDRFIFNGRSTFWRSRKTMRLNISFDDVTGINKSWLGLALMITTRDNEYRFSDSSGIVITSLETLHYLRNCVGM